MKKRDLPYHLRKLYNFIFQRFDGYDNPRYIKFGLVLYFDTAKARREFVCESLNAVSWMPDVLCVEAREHGEEYQAQTELRSRGL